MFRGSFFTKSTALLMGAVFSIGVLAVPVSASAAEPKTTIIFMDNHSDKSKVSKKDKYERERRERIERERERKERLERERKEKERRKRIERERREREQARKTYKRTYSEGDRNTAAIVGAAVGYMLGKAGV